MTANDARLWANARDLRNRQLSGFSHEASTQSGEIGAQRDLLTVALLDVLDTRREMLGMLARALEYRNAVTGRHMTRISGMCAAIATAMGLDEDFVASITLASPLYDVGKIGVPDHVLNSQGVLTPAEWELMKEHCRIGEAILTPLNASPNPGAHSYGVFTASQDWAGEMQIGGPALGEFRNTPPPATTRNTVLEMAARLALSHHERWDGTGYPMGISGSTIPIEARILAVADVYDALRSRRPYKPAFSEEDTVATIREAVGHHFDPAVAAAFEGCRDEVREIFETTPDRVLEDSEAA